MTGAATQVSSVGLQGRFTVLDLMRDPELLGGQFAGPSWAAWRAFMCALFGLEPEDASAEALIRRCTGREALPCAPAREGWIVVGRRGGKSLAVAVIAIYLAVFRRYRLMAGEVGTVMILAADKRQARTIKRYVSGLMRSTPLLEELIANETTEGIELTNRITIEIHAASFRAVRGYTCVAVLADEVAFWRTDDDSANPDTEILNALRPSLATTSGLLIALSSPYARRGELYKQWRAHFRQDGDPVLVWQAPTELMNPSVPADVSRGPAKEGRTRRDRKSQSGATRRFQKQARWSADSKSRDGHTPNAFSRQQRNARGASSLKGIAKRA